jgi:hypothetical protein
MAGESYKVGNTEDRGSDLEVKTIEDDAGVHVEQISNLCRIVGEGT